MTYTKATAFGEEQQELAKMAKVLSHPARIAILQHLARTQRCISGDIAQEIPLSRTTVSQHLQELKSAGLIKGEIDGLTVCYCIDKEQFTKAAAMMATFLQQVASSYDCDCQPNPIPA
ncbi:ArsR/SmtB family transcription factor [Pontibacter roseus]|uniref:ArsR/SmtB family transcription factor n=1 Tax=Pontibacter roseus TaxID=336989 RepID=UPI00039FCE44|nr:metalloregulator ArsR/SmtB family transcription factor [Pontibacter roseus]